VADDEDGIRHLVAAVVRRLGLDILTADDGAAAVHLAQEYSTMVACVILDIRMPILDGVTAAQLIRQIDPDLPIILMSASFSSDYAARIAALDIVHLLHKPFSLAGLQSLIRPFSFLSSNP
jgi:CheY-like chemotaxis protein